MLPNEQLVNVVVGVVFFITDVLELQVTFCVVIGGVGGSVACDWVAASIRSSSLTSLFTSDINSNRSNSSVSVGFCS